jgi:peptidyl-prolyl cis-trans isomerase B (cyclophilin B)
MRLAGTMRATAAILAALAALAVGACGGGDSSSTTSTAATGASAAGCQQVDTPAPKDVHFSKPEQVLKPGQSATATVETSCGSFEIKLETESSPKTANSFAFLADKGVYDGTTFHRVVPGFVIQGGDPKGNGQGGPGYSVTEAPPQNTSYKNGLVAMAKTAVEPAGTSGSQFFVVTAPADAGLPPDYAVLGQVTSGMDTVDAIAALGDPSDPSGKPTQTVTIDKVTINTS